MSSTRKEFPLPLNFDAVVVVWGRDYVQRFLDITLPSLLAEGNFPAVKAVGKFTLHLYAFCKEVDELFKPHPVWQFFCQNFNVHYESLETYWRADGKNMNDRFLNMISAQNHFFGRSAANPQTAMIFISPDVLYSNRFMAFQLERFREGYRTVVFNGLRVLRDAAIPEIMKYFEPGVANILSVPASEVIKLFRRNEHPVFKLRYFGGENVATTTSLWFWKDTDGNIVLRSLHWQPVIIWPEVKYDYDNNKVTYDSHYGQSIISAQRIYFQEDMRDLVGLDLAGEVLADGDSAISGSPNREVYMKAIVDWFRNFDIRVYPNILYFTIIPVRDDVDTKSPEVQTLISKSLADAQYMLSYLHKSNNLHSYGPAAYRLEMKKAANYCHRELKKIRKIFMIFLLVFFLYGVIYLVCLFLRPFALGR